MYKSEHISAVLALQLGHSMVTARTMAVYLTWAVISDRSLAEKQQQ